MTEPLKTETFMIRRETKHSMKRRSPWHDYRAKGIYMLTLVVHGRKPLLGKLVEENGLARVECSPLGRRIAHQEILKITKY